MSRFTFGPPLGTVNLVAPDPNAPVVPVVPITPTTPTTPKSDIAITFNGVTPVGVFSFAVPAYDLATTNQLDAIHVGLYTSTDPVPSDPALIVSAPLHYMTGCTTLTEGGVVAVDATDAPVGEFVALAVLEFAE